MVCMYYRKRPARARPSGLVYSCQVYNYARQIYSAFVQGPGLACVRIQYLQATSLSTGRRFEPDCSAAALGLFLSLDHATIELNVTATTLMPLIIGYFL